MILESSLNSISALAVIGLARTLADAPSEIDSDSGMLQLAIGPAAGLSSESVSWNAMRRRPAESLRRRNGIQVTVSTT
jgi:hypothetical protein